MPCNGSREPRIGAVYNTSFMCLKSLQDSLCEVLHGGHALKSLNLIRNTTKPPGYISAHHGRVFGSCHLSCSEYRSSGVHIPMYPNVQRHNSARVRVLNGNTSHAICHFLAWHYGEVW